MNSKSVFLFLFHLLIFIGLQVLVFRNLDFFGLAYCFCYVGVVLFLPIKTNPAWVMLLAFLIGLGYDAFCDTPGIHASASVLLGFLRKPALNLFKPPGGYEEYMEVSVGHMGWRWFLNFILPLLVVHHLYLFLVEYAGFDHFLMAIIQSVCSVFFTFIVLLGAQFALNKPANLV